MGLLVVLLTVLELEEAAELEFWLITPCGISLSEEAAEEETAEEDVDVEVDVDVDVEEDEETSEDTAEEEEVSCVVEDDEVSGVEAIGSCVVPAVELEAGGLTSIMVV